VLLMDEPFSSLDELTAEALRSDVINMMRSQDTNVSLVVIVTHNVEEAVELSNKVVILSERPSHVKEIKRIRLKYPRNKRSGEFMREVSYIYKVLTE